MDEEHLLLSSLQDRPSQGAFKLSVCSVELIPAFGDPHCSVHRDRIEKSENRGGYFYRQCGDNVEFPIVV